MTDSRSEKKVIKTYETKKQVSEIFNGFKGTPLLDEMPVRTYNVRPITVPKIDPKHVFHYDIGFRKVLYYLQHGKGQKPFIYGHKGTGKTSLVKQIAARLGRHLREEYAGEQMEANDWLVRVVAGKNGLEHTEAILVEAMRKGHWVLINEFDLMPALEQKRLNDLWENDTITLPCGTPLKAHKDFRLVVTANTNNCGDHSGSYGNLAAGDSSVGDRFFFVKMDYLAREEEERILIDVMKEHCQYIGVKGPIDTFQNTLIPSILDYAHDIRESHMKSETGGDSSGGLPFSISTRKLISWLESAITEIYWGIFTLQNENKSSDASSVVRTFYESALETLKIDFINGQPVEFERTLIEFYSTKHEKKFSFS
ncbi:MULTISPECIES: AAA family ATPase [Vibrio]|jgi:cobaltochelatase CobS|uniref:AAA family ATPase n=1 Tax=Vibrio TaxID=662 RepID=UPI0008419AA1|nr:MULTISPECIES: AAA family ATPase [Vibrio]ODM56852.1 hypothetical protein BC455_18505 [Vibrio harveyi]USD58506.1 AAA family ATPase [Vibrio sp. SCSIO 43155]